jgi:hypothetical protein
LIVQLRGDSGSGFPGFDTALRLIARKKMDSGNGMALILEQARGNQGIDPATEQNGNFFHSKKMVLVGRICIARVGQAGTHSSQILHFF